MPAVPNVLVTGHIVEPYVRHGRCGFLVTGAGQQMTFFKGHIIFVMPIALKLLKL